MVKDTLPPIPALKPIEKTRISDQVVVQLTNLILEGAFKPGEKLPPERELAAQLYINRTSLREALRRMETMGLIQVKPGYGVFVKNPDTSSGLDFVKFLIENGIGLDKNMIRSLAEIRRIFAKEIIHLAAERIDKQGLERLQEIVDNYPDQATAERLSGEHDFAFFHEIARATGNKVFVFMLNTIREVIERMSAVYLQVEGEPRIAADLYAKIVEAFRAKDPERAVALFQQQVDRDDQALSKLLEGMK